MSEAPQKMKGVLAQLFTYSEDGKAISSKVVFRPNCDWFIPKLGDNLAEVEFESSSMFEEFGDEIMTSIYLDRNNFSCQG